MAATVKLVDAVVALATKLPLDQSPLSRTKDPAPTIDVVFAYPVKARVCPVARAETVMLEFRDVALDGSVMLAVTAVLFDETAKDVFPTNEVRAVDTTVSALLTSPIAEIEVVLASIFV